MFQNHVVHLPIKNRIENRKAFIVIVIAYNEIWKAAPVGAQGPTYSTRTTYNTTIVQLAKYSTNSLKYIYIL